MKIRRVAGLGVGGFSVAFLLACALNGVGCSSSSSGSPGTTYTDGGEDAEMTTTDGSTVSDATTSTATDASDAGTKSDAASDAATTTDASDAATVSDATSDAEPTE